MPLYWGLVPNALRAKVAANLAARVHADGDHINVGLLGTKSILNALSENGYADLAYQLASQKTFPSWGWWIMNGATTLYENWSIDAQSDVSSIISCLERSAPGYLKALVVSNLIRKSPALKIYCWNRILFPASII